MFQLALHGSSFVGKRFGYHPQGNWEQCVKALSDYYAPLDTFGERFDALLAHVAKLGFSRMDIWQPAELNWQWATEAHIEKATELIHQHNIAISSLAGEFGVTREEFISACKLTQAIGAPILSGTTALLAEDRFFVIDTLEKYGLKLAIENEVELTPKEMLAEIGNNGRGCLGTAIDTGWWATHRYDVVRAINELSHHIFHVHLKDVLPGDAHVNCGYGNGCVPITSCIHALMDIGYERVVSIENHALDHDPDEELVEGRRLVEDLMIGKN